MLYNLNVDFDKLAAGKSKWARFVFVFFAPIFVSHTNHDFSGE